MRTLRAIFSFIFLLGVVCVYAQNDSVHLVDASKSAYTIIYGAAGGSVAKNAATQFQTAIKNVTGVTIPIATDATASKAREIILGPTNTRPECAMQNTGIKAAGAFGYRIALVEKKVIISATDANHMVLALKRFEAAILKETAVAGTGFLYLEKARTQVADFSHTQATLRNIVAYNLSHSLDITEVVHVPQYNADIKVSQGVCTDGTYAYFAMRCSGDTLAVVYKYRMSDWTYVAKTAVFRNGGHCNDLIYDWPNQRVICLYANDKTTPTVVMDPATMKTSTGPVFTGGATAADYNRKTGLYVHRNGQNLYIRESPTSSTTVLSGKRGDGLTMTTQGMGTDDDYFYFPNSPGDAKEDYNMLAVYSWADCSWKMNLKIPGGNESEGMFEWDGVYYISYYQKYNGSSKKTGATLYRIDVTLTYKAGV